MDGPKIDENYRQKYEGVYRISEGEVVAFFSDTLGRTRPLGEKYLLRAYKIAAANYAFMPPDAKATVSHKMAVSQEGRAAIQAYKKRHGIPLDTPPVDQPVNITANDENYGADILHFEH